jgi:hypothetical protein
MTIRRHNGPAKYKKEEEEVDDKSNGQQIQLHALASNEVYCTCTQLQT